MRWRHMPMPARCSWRSWDSSRDPRCGAGSRRSSSTTPNSISSRSDHRVPRPRRRLAAGGAAVLVAGAVAAAMIAAGEGETTGTGDGTAGEQRGGKAARHGRRAGGDRPGHRCKIGTAHRSGQNARIADRRWRSPLGRRRGCRHAAQRGHGIGRRGDAGDRRHAHGRRGGRGSGLGRRTEGRSNAPSSSGPPLRRSSSSTRRRARAARRSRSRATRARSRIVRERPGDLDSGGLGSDGQQVRSCGSIRGRPRSRRGRGSSARSRWPRAEPASGRCSTTPPWWHSTSAAPACAGACGCRRGADRDRRRRDGGVGDVLGRRDALADRPRRRGGQRRGRFGSHRRHRG